MTIEEIKKRLQEIVDALEDENSDVDTEALEEESRSLTKQLKELQKMEERKKIASKINEGVVEARQITDEELNQEVNKTYETRKKDLVEHRSITVSSSSLLTPTHQSKEINDTFTPVSRLFENADVEDLEGGESYQEAYVKSYSKGGQTDEGADYTSAEPEFGYADVDKVKITAYVEKVENAMRIAVVKKMIEQMLNGTGTKSFKGIFKNTTEITGNDDVVISEINNTTLDDIVFNYGGPEETEEDAVLILSKEDLKAFSKVRSTDGKKVYTIDTKAKTIDTIPYIISSECHSVSANDTTAGTYNCMAYGSLKNYKVAVFSDLEVEKSTDYQFKKGMTCYRAEVMAGGNVVKYNGFVRVKKVVAEVTANQGDN